MACSPTDWQPCSHRPAASHLLLQSAWQHAALLTIKGLLPDPLAVHSFVHLSCIMGDKSLYLYTEQQEASQNGQPFPTNRVITLG